MSAHLLPDRARIRCGAPQVRPQGRRAFQGETKPDRLTAPLSEAGLISCLRPRQTARGVRLFQPRFQCLGKFGNLDAANMGRACAGHLPRIRGGIGPQSGGNFP